MGERKVGEDLAEPHTRAELWGDHQSVLAVLAEPGLDRIGNGECRVVHRWNRPIAEVADVLSEREQHDGIVAVPHTGGGS